MITTGEALRLIRLSRGQTLKEIAIDLCVSQGNISETESGKHEPRDLARYSRVYGISEQSIRDFRDSITDEDQASPFYVALACEKLVNIIKRDAEKY